MTDGLSDESTDESTDVQAERNFPRFWTFQKIHKGTFIGIFTMNFADGWTDRTDDRHTNGQTEFQVESHFG